MEVDTAAEDLQFWASDLELTDLQRNVLLRLLRVVEKCKAEVTVPLSSEGVPAADLKRVEQFLKGGALYCPKCYPTVPACDDCGWHVPMERVAEHFRAVHAHHSH